MEVISLFFGHAGAGLATVLIAIWWCTNIFKDFYLSKCSGKIYKTQPWYTSKYCQKVPLDTLLKLMMAIPFMILIIYHQRQNKDFDINVLHFMMVAAYGLSAVCDLLKCNRVFPLPSGIEAATGIMTFFHVAFLFYAHSSTGRNPTDEFLHKLMFYLALLIAGAIYIETSQRNTPMPSLMRAFLVQLFGTWFFQIGVFLYPPKKWYTTNHNETVYSVPTMAATFSIHVFANFCLVLIVGAIIWKCMKKWEIHYLHSYASVSPNNRACISEAENSALLSNDTCEIQKKHSPFIQ